jgi:hypothetical protein
LGVGGAGRGQDSDNGSGKYPAQRAKSSEIGKNGNRSG